MLRGVEGAPFDARAEASDGADLQGCWPAKHVRKRARIPQHTPLSLGGHVCVGAHLALVVDAATKPSAFHTHRGG